MVNGLPLPISGKRFILDVDGVLNTSLEIMIFKLI